jgi:hypothetical protein
VLRSRTAVLTPLLAVALAGAAAAPAVAKPRLEYSFHFTGARTVFDRFELRGLADGSSVTVTCLTKSGDRCPGALHRRYVNSDAAGTLRIRRFEDHALGAGRRLEASIVSGPLLIDKTVRIMRDKPPTLTTREAPITAGGPGD